MAQLPEELILLICVHLRPADGKRMTRVLTTRTLLSLCLTSRDWYRVARPQLYQMLDFEDRRISSFRPAVRTLHEHPQFRGAVHELRVKSWKKDHDIETVLLSEAPLLDDALHVPLDSLTLGLSDDDELKLRHGIRSGLEDADLALLLYLCPEIEVMSFVSSWESREFLVYTAFRHASTDPLLAASPDWDVVPRPLQHVREVAVTCRDTYERTEIDEIGPILRSPSLVTLKGNRLCVHGAHVPIIAVTTTLKHLILDITCADIGGIGCVLSTCQSLETLSLRWGDESAFASAAREGRNLKHLRVERSEIAEIPIWPADLLSLPDLESLSLPAGGSFGAEMEESDKYHLLENLPTTLRTLELTGSDESLCDHVDYDTVIYEILTSDRSPHLTTVSIPRDAWFSRDLSATRWVEHSNKECRVLLQHAQRQ
ncbi:hypothetical protein LTR95_007187 [Oleoguttula sp. CCFEE 5521]